MLNIPLNAYVIKLRRGYLGKGKLGRLGAVSKAKATAYDVYGLRYLVNRASWSAKWRYLVQEFQRIPNPNYVEQLPKNRNREQRKKEFADKQQLAIDLKKATIKEILKGYKVDAKYYRERLATKKEHIRLDFEIHKLQLKELEQRHAKFAK